LTILGSLVLAPAAVSAADDGPGPASQWSQNLWRTALQSDRSTLDSFDNFFSRIPETKGRADQYATRVQESLQLHRMNRDLAQTKREEARVESAKKMHEHLAATDLSQALRSAVEVQTLRDNLDSAFDDAEINQIIAWAERRIPEVETQNDWLYAQELLYRLRTLYEDTSRQEEYERHRRHLDMVNRRVSLLANYAPRRLHELRVQQAERLEEEPIEAFNAALAVDWNERVSGITSSMLKAALRAAAEEHIESRHWKPLMRGGLNELKLLASTSGLEETFPKIGDVASVSEWMQEIDRQLAVLEATDDRHVNRRYGKNLLDDLVRLNERTLQLERAVVYREFGDGAMYELDEFSEIIWPDKLRRFKQATEGNFIGVGILIRHNDKREIMVVNPLEGPPAYFAGIKPDDLIQRVDGESTVGWSLNDAVDKITGPKNVPVTLGIRREGVEQLLDVPIVRDVIKLRSVKGWWKEGLDAGGEPEWDWFIDPVCGIAYIKLTQFTEDTYRDLVMAWHQIRRERRPNGVILDLRYNPGGLLTSAVQISNLFVDKGEIVTGEDKEGFQAWSQHAQPGRAELGGVPTVVLINKGSASASEIVAGCLQAYGLAVVVGERSYGKGSVQTVHQIGRDSALKLTTQYYRLPAMDGGAVKGRLVHKRPGASVWGVDPDIEVKMTPSQVVDSITLRQAADIIPEGDDGELDPNSPDRPDIKELLTAGTDPQLSTALLLLQAQALGRAQQDTRRASLN
jgi:carboxyl-terminal processing protease